MSRLPTDLLTLFADLADRVVTARASGTVYRRERDGIDYVYAKVDDGTSRTDVFLGRADDPSVTDRITALEAGRRDARARRATIRLLRSAGFAAPDRHLGAILSEVSAAGLFDRGAVLIGTVAYTVIQPIVGAKLPATSLMTRDIDLLTRDLRLAAIDDEPLLSIIRRVDPSYQAVPLLDHRAWPYRFRNAEGYLVDLLTPSRSRGDGETLALPRLEAGAAPLPYLRWLTEAPARTVALVGAGVPVRVPQPARYAIHKLIVAQRRDPANAPKRMKDLAQAAALMDALGEIDPFALEDALEDARAQGKAGWSDPIDRSLAEIARGLHSTR